MHRHVHDCVALEIGIILLLVSKLLDGVNVEEQHSCLCWLFDDIW